MCFVWIAKGRVPERNVARQKPAIQSSIFEDAYAWKAVDGIFSGIGASCTLGGLHSWWAVDLGKRFLVQEVAVTTDRNVEKGTHSM